MSAICITLGHHASVLYIDQNNKVIGYEEERLNKIKASSLFPILALKLIEKKCNIKKGSFVFVTHWFDQYDFYQSSSKYFNLEFFKEFVQRYQLVPHFLSSEFTHHDAHAYASLAFFRSKLTIKQSLQLEQKDKIHFIVADGYGNSQEVISIYEMEVGCLHKTKTTKDTPPLKLVEKKYGYQYSLGLMYKFACGFVGLKENQDEYKFLGYEAHLKDEFSDVEIQSLTVKSCNIASRLWIKMSAQPDARRPGTSIKQGKMIKSDELYFVKDQWIEHFEELLESLHLSTTNDIYKVRVAIAFYVQSVVEHLIRLLILKHDIKHIGLSGGLFYNVKLNNLILKKVSGLLSVTPVAGDQGCGIGMYEYYIGGFPFGNLKYGQRPSFAQYQDKLKTTEYCQYSQYVSFFKKNERSSLINYVSDQLKANRVINVVLRHMEFGPRALCNTSTLALPYLDNVAYINSLNQRSSIMPMAPVLQLESAGLFFDENEVQRVVGSNLFMVITHDYHTPDLEYYGGVMHKYPLYEAWSGRPQFITKDTSFIYDVLELIKDKHPILINTSFNIHGQPIVYSLEDILNSFKFQVDQALSKKQPPPLLVLSDLDE